MGGVFRKDFLGSACNSFFDSSVYRELLFVEVCENLESIIVRRLKFANTIDAYKEIENVSRIGYIINQSLSFQGFRRTNKYKRCIYGKNSCS